MNKKRRSNWYIYVITFVVTGLLLILVSSILLKSFYDSQDKDATVNVSQNQTAIFTPDSTYDFSVLVTLSADNDKTPDKYMTITYIAKNNTFVLMPYLPNAVIDGGNTIKQICEQSGEAEVAKLLSSKTGLSINKYIRFTKSTLTELFDMVGNTTLTVHLLGSKNLRTLLYNSHGVILFILVLYLARYSQSCVSYHIEQAKIYHQSGEC